MSEDKKHQDSKEQSISKYGKTPEEKRISEIKTIAITALIFSPIIMVIIMIALTALNIILFIFNAIKKATPSSILSNIGFYDAKEFLLAMLYAAKTGKTNYYGMKKIKSKNPDEYISDDLES